MLPSLKIKLGNEGEFARPGLGDEGEFPRPDLLRNATEFLKINFCGFRTSFLFDISVFSRLLKVYIVKDLRLSKSFQPGICTDLNTLWVFFFPKPI